MRVESSDTTKGLIEFHVLLPLNLFSIQWVESQIQERHPWLNSSERDKWEEMKRTRIKIAIVFVS